MAMDEFKGTSCVTWVPKDAGNPDHNYFVHILKGEGCHSPIGRQPPGGQILSLGKKLKKAQDKEMDNRIFAKSVRTICDLFLLLC